MAVRVTASEVMEIMPTNLTESEIDPYITSANVIVNDQLTDSGLSATILKEIEKWLTAHLIASTKERQAQEKELGDGREKYGATGKYGSIGEGLATTTYGIMVTNLDTTGTLNQIGKQQASIQVVPQFDDSELLE